MTEPDARTCRLLAGPRSARADRTPPERELHARVAALEAENAALRVKLGGGGGPTAAEPAERRLRLILESATDYAIYATDLDRRVTDWNEGARRLLGWSEADVLGREADVFYPPEDRAEQGPEREADEARARGQAVNERWHVRRDGSRFWGSGMETPLLGTGGEALGFVKIMRDRTESHEAQERQALLVGELNHRVKNALAVALAVMDQTWRATVGAGEPAERFREDFVARLRALARAHDLLTQDDRRGATLADLVRAALAPYDGGREEEAGTSARVEAAGPAVQVQAGAVVALAMALHELATNAAKHGALSVPGGRVSVTWRAAEGAQGDRALELDWTESGGPPVAGPPRRRGFGSVLLTRGLKGQLGGEVALDFAPGGLRCRVRVPLSERVAVA